MLVTQTYIAFTQPDEITQEIDKESISGIEDALSEGVENESFEGDEYEDDTDDAEEPNFAQEGTHKRYINKITVSGNIHIPSEAILNRLPFKLGEAFNPAKTSSAIRNLYGLGYFRQIEILAEDIEPNLINIHVELTEKKKLEAVRYEGNKHLSETEVKKKVDFSKIPAIDEEELKKYADILKNIYVDKGYHFATVEPRLEIDGDKATAIFKIEEHKPSVVKQIFFKGNKFISSKKLRVIMFTREDWVLSFMDSAGTYHPDAVEMDRHTIETFYKNNGFLTARVTDVVVDMNPTTKNFYLTFHIEEGPQYTVTDIKVPGNDIMSEEELLRVLPIKKGTLYSHAKVQKSMELLRNIWGEHGYIYADVEPSIQPDEDKKTVTIAFYTELGSKVRLNRINIIGNKKSRDKVIRRQLIIDEGDLLTTQRMEFSKNRVELLGYFDKRDGVNWKINRISDDLCDLDLIVKEVRTGNATVQLGAGGSVTDITDPTQALILTLGFADTNLFGRGINYDLNLMLSKQEQSGHFNLLDPWLFNKPISGALSLFASSVTYQDLRSVQQQVSERRVGGSGGIGFFLPYPRDTHVQFIAGAENISYGSRQNQGPVAANFSDPVAQAQFQEVLNRRFQNGTLAWVSNLINQDLRNHPLHPSRGYQWSSALKVGLSVSRTGQNEPTTPVPANHEKFGFFKFEGDVSYYTPLIGENDLVLCLHGHVGLVHQFHNHTIPYRELFHVGGPATVRGFVFGQISPMFQNNSIGARKAFWNNVELIFPINPDFSIKGAIFYDGGAGWDTPDAQQISPVFLRNNEFHYRHAIGVGLRLLNPAPLQIDWGFKLDRNKKAGEVVTEIHFVMNHNF